MANRGVSRTGLAMVMLAACAPVAVFAMHVRADRTELARAADGAALYEVREAGPEGGGALTYRVEGKAPGDAVDFVVSSDFSPGDGSRPQRVSPATCRQRLAALGAELAKRKIAGATVHPDRCDARSRSGLVTTKR